MDTLRLSVKDLSFSYKKEIPVLSGVSFDIQAGEFVTIWGENGSGKSTLFSLINGLLIPPAGAVRVIDSAGNEFDPAIETQLFGLRKTAGTVLQNPDNQITASTVEEDCAFAPENLGLSPSEVQTRVTQALSVCGIEELRGKPVHSLSGGEKQRLALAGILSFSPEILLLDECTSMLDEKARSAFHEILKKLLEKGLCVLQITHLAEDAARSPRCIVLKKGKIIHDGSPPPEIFEKRARIPIVSSKNKEKSSKKAAVEFSEVSYNYAVNSKGKDALSDLSFVVNENESAALVGENGSGKSTALKHINALLLPALGRVFALQKDSLDKKISLTEFRRQAALCVQNPESALFETHVADDVAYGARLLGLKGRVLYERVKAALDEAGLPFSDFADRETASLSGGEARLAALAGVLALDSPIMLLDEPTAGLDAYHTELVEKALYTLVQKGKTVIVTAHNSDFASLFERVLELKSGKLLAAPDSDVIKDNKIENSSVVSKKRWSVRRKTGLEFFQNTPFGEFSGKDSRLRRLSAAFKLLFTFGFFILTAILPGIVFPFGFFLALILLCPFLARETPLNLLRGFLPVLPLILILILLRLLFSGEGVESAVLFTLGPVSITQNEALETAAIIIKLFSMMTLISLYSRTTPLRETLAALKKAMPKTKRREDGAFFRDLSLTLEIALRFVPVVLYEAGQIAASRLSRGAKTKGFAKISFTLSILAPLFLRSLERARTLANAMLLRLYR